MGNCCFCLRLTDYGIAIGYLEITIRSVYLISLLFDPAPKRNGYVVFGTIVGSSIYMTVAVFLIIGSVKHIQRYILPYLIVTVSSISIATLAVLIYAFLSPTEASILAVYVVVTCLIIYPIYLLYIELGEETRNDTTV